MTLLFMDGVDWRVYGYDTLTYTTVSNGFDYAATYGYGGGYGGRIVSTTSYCQKTVPNSTTLILGAMMKVTSLSGTYSVVTFNDSTSIQIGIRFGTSGQISVYRGTTLLGSSANGYVAINTWYHFEFKVVFSQTAGSVTVRRTTLPGGTPTTIYTLTGVDTCSTANSYANSLLVRAGGNTCYWDNIYLCDDLGTMNNDFLGPKVVWTGSPTQDGTYTQFTPYTGTNHTAMVGQIPVDLSGYVASSTAGHRDSYQMSEPETADNVAGIQITSMCYLNGAGVNTIKPFIISGTVPTITDSAAQTITASYKGYSAIWEKEPIDNVNWDRAKIAAMEVGIKNESVS